MMRCARVPPVRICSCPDLFFPHHGSLRKSDKRTYSFTQKGRKNAVDQTDQHFIEKCVRLISLNEAPDLLYSCTHFSPRATYTCPCRRIDAPATTGVCSQTLSQPSGPLQLRPCLGSLYALSNDISISTNQYMIRRFLKISWPDPTREILDTS